LCWGSDQNGRLGLGAPLENVGDNETLSSSGALNLEAGLINVSAGGGHICIEIGFSSGTKCWGRNESGQLGIGNNNDVGDNELLSDLELIDFGSGLTELTRVVAGSQHTCAILPTGDVRCWGNNAHGQLGLGDAVNRGSSERVSIVPDVPLPIDTAHQLALGEGFTCGIFDSDRDLICWGQNDLGQLGLETFGDVGDEAGEIENIDDVDVDEGVLDVAAGSAHVCALLVGGRVQCFGADQEVGALGTGGVSSAIVGDEDIEIPEQLQAVSFPSDADVVAVRAGLGRFTCALLADDRVFCWGANDSGQLGQGDTNASGDAVEVDVLP
jgi:alpha-tubulin suppressor-like RCC1 family protein